MAGSDTALPHLFKALHRQGLLFPEDRGNDAVNFAALALKRMRDRLGPLPNNLRLELVSDRVTFSSQYNGGDWSYERRGGMLTAFPAWIFKVETHLLEWCEPFFSKLHPPAAAWLGAVLFSIAGPLAFTPHEYHELIAMTFWQGENDETLAAEEFAAQTPGGTPADDAAREWTGPRLATLKDYLPPWAMTRAVGLSPKENLAMLNSPMSSLLYLNFGLKEALAPLFDAAGKLVSVEFGKNGYLGCGNDLITPFFFAWRENDWVHQAIDDHHNMIDNCEGHSDAAAIVSIDNPHAEDTLRKLTTIVNALDKIIRLASGTTKG